jgi:hypothetical protein
LLKRKNSYTLVEAEQKFEEAWKIVLQKSFDVLAKKEDIKKRIL